MAETIPGLTQVYLGDKTWYKWLTCICLFFSQGQPGRLMTMTTFWWIPCLPPLQSVGTVNPTPPRWHHHLSYTTPLLPDQWVFPTICTSAWTLSCHFWLPNFTLFLTLFAEHHMNSSCILTPWLQSEACKINWSGLVLLNNVWGDMGSAGEGDQMSLMLLYHISS